jgi:rare lipoprotein A (peptidoglycan hydrolase)
MFGFRFFWTLGLALYFCVPNWGQAHAASDGRSPPAALRLVAAAQVKKEHRTSSASRTQASAKAGKQTKNSKEHAKSPNKKLVPAKTAHSPPKGKRADKPAARSPLLVPAGGDWVRHKRHGLLPPPSAELPQSGIASWVGKYFQGRPVAAAGEIHDMQSLTAAHRAIAFNSILKVTDLNNERSILVRINDRGPYVRGRVIDLARGAAEYLGYADKGLTRVRLDFAGNARDPALRYYIRLRPPDEPGKAGAVQGFGPFDTFDEAALLFMSVYKGYPDVELMVVKEKS